MQRIYRYLKGWFERALHSLAVIPVPMVLIAIGLGFVLFYIERVLPWSAWLTENYPAIALQSQDTARSILSLFIGGLITLMVFTFTQIMTLLNSVANSYSPRLLPWMTADRSLQFVMGFYLSTIVLTIMVMLSIRSDNEGLVASFSVLVCTLLGIICLILFLYFVTTISSRIQVGSIIRSVYERGANNFTNWQRKEGFDRRYWPNTEEWYAVPTPLSGFVGGVDFPALSRMADRFDTRIAITVAKGHYLPKNLPLLRTERRLTDEQVERVMTAVSPRPIKFDEWYLPHLKLLVEIAVKAMSPGINDPGTALDAIDRIGGLFSLLMNRPFPNYYRHKERGEVYFAVDGFEELLQASMAELRTYCRQDPLVVRSLIRMLYQLKAEIGIDYRFGNRVDRELISLIYDARRSIVTPADRRRIAADVFHHRGALRVYLKETKFTDDGEGLAKVGFRRDD